MLTFCLSISVLEVKKWGVTRQLNVNKMNSSTYFHEQSVVLTTGTQNWVKSPKFCHKMHPETSEFDSNDGTVFKQFSYCRNMTACLHQAVEPYWWWELACFPNGSFLKPVVMTLASSPAYRPLSPNVLANSLRTLKSPFVQVHSPSLASSGEDTSLTFKIVWLLFKNV